MEDLKGFLIFFSDKDSSKRVTLFKSFIELSIIILYSIFSFVWLFGNYKLIEPTEFSDLYEFFISGYLFVCLLIFSFWFIIVRTLHYYIIYYIDYIIIGAFRSLSKKLEIKPMKLLIYLDIIEIGKNKKHFVTGKRFELFNELLKYFYHEPKDKLLKTLFHNNSLIIQFSLILLIFVSQRVHFPNIFNVIIWIVLIYMFINQLFIFYLLKILDQHGYKIFEKLEGFKRYNDNYNSVNSSFNPDKPIFSESQNLLLKRDYFSGILYNSIKNYTDKESLVIGIDGKWGDGKTSFVNMSLERFIYNTDDKKYVMFFNPWNFTNPTELTTHFLNELKRYLRKILGNKYSDDLNEKLFLYINYITKGNFQTPNDIIVQENDTETIKKEIDRVLRNLDFKLIIVVDDLDRLTGDETKQVFRFVKLVGDFPNLIYIIPFDKQKTISECCIEEDYLKKIVQIEIKLPPILSSEIIVIFNDRLNSFLKTTGFNSFNPEKWNTSINGPIKYYIKNLRDVNRIMNALKFYLSSNHVKELNINDFICLTIVQIFDAKLYSFIGNNKTYFTSINSDYNTKFKEELEKIKNTFTIDQNLLYNLLADLFPQVKKLSINYMEINETRVWRRENRICSDSYFDRFFLFPFESDKLTKEQIEEIIANTNDIELFKNDIERIIKDNCFDFFIDRFMDYQYNSNIKIDKKKVIKSFLSLGKIIPHDTKKTLLFFSPKDHTQYAIHKYFEDEPQLLLDKNFIDEIITDDRNDIDSLIDLYFRICKQWGFNRENSFDKKNFEADEKLAPLLFLHTNLLNRIRKSFIEICALPNMDDIIYYWRKMDSKNDKIDLTLKNYLENSSANFYSFFNVLKKSIFVQSSNYGYKTREVYDIDGIKDVIDIEYLKKESDALKNIIKIKSDYNDSQEVNEQIFLYNKSLFDKCISGEIDYKDREWYKKDK